MCIFNHMIFLTLKDNLIDPILDVLPNDYYFEFLGYLSKVELKLHVFLELVEVHVPTEC